MTSNQSASFHCRVVLGTLVDLKFVYVIVCLGIIEPGSFEDKNAFEMCLSTDPQFDRKNVFFQPFARLCCGKQVGSWKIKPEQGKWSITFSPQSLCASEKLLSFHPPH